MRRLASDVVVVAIACVLSLSCRPGPPPDEAANPKPGDQPPATQAIAMPTFADFSERIDLYMAERARAEARVPELKETSDPSKVYDREKALGMAIRTVRANASQGEIFTDAAEVEFRRIVEADFAQRTAADRSAVLEEVPAKFPPKINTDYPTSLPLATFPPSLLMNLPTLPDVLEYRFLGRHLILRDIKGNVIIDYVPNAVPATVAAAAGK
jgi:hypothetical protein